MSNPTGQIQDLIDTDDGVRAIIEVDVSQACPRCAAGKGCGAGLFTGTSGKRNVEAMVAEQLNLAKGDAVEIGLASQNLLKAALIVYGLPLVGALTTAGSAYLFGAADSVAAVAAITGLLLGLLVGRSYLAREGCIDEFVPYVEKRLQGPQTGR